MVSNRSNWGKISGCPGFSLYPGDLGVVKEGAYADLLLVDDNPLEDVKVVGELENLRVIIKDGQVYKNTL